MQGIGTFGGNFCFGVLVSVLLAFFYLLKKNFNAVNLNGAELVPMTIKLSSQETSLDQHVWIISRAKLRTRSKKTTLPYSLPAKRCFQRG